MAIEYNNLYFQIKQRPSPKRIMVSIPLFMYRVETNEFEHGLNFFQKTVLKLKAKPGIGDETIAEHIGLDPKLISIVSAELQRKDLINKYGSLSQKGKEKLNEVDGLTISPNRKKIGYVFRYLDQDQLYPFYINKVFPADLSEDAKEKHPKIITGTKGDGQDYTDLPFFLDQLFRLKKNFNRPSVREVLQLILNTNKKGNTLPDDELENEKLSKQLSLRFINENPEIAWVCTYVYLPQNADETFKPDWRVLDPFGFGDNVSLKFYLNNPINQTLLDNIQKKFGEAKTINGKVFSDFQEQMNNLVHEKLLSDFSFGLNQLDGNLQQYVEAIVRHEILLKNHGYNDLDASLSFSLNLQNALENIFKLDKASRARFYEKVYVNLDDFQKKKSSLKNIFRQQLSSINTPVPNALIGVCNGNLKNKKSLRSYLVSFILTYNYDNNSALFHILKDQIELINEIAALRNEKGHGRTSNESPLTPLSRQEVEKFYAFIKSFINDYIQHN